MASWRINLCYSMIILQICLVRFTESHAYLLRFTLFKKTIFFIFISILSFAKLVKNWFELHFFLFRPLLSKYFFTCQLWSQPYDEIHILDVYYWWILPNYVPIYSNPDLHTALPSGTHTQRRQKVSDSQWAQNICITFIQRRPSVFDVGPTLCKCYTNVLCLWVAMSSSSLHSYHNWSRVHSFRKGA